MELKPNQAKLHLRFSYTVWFNIIVGICVAYNFQNGRNKIELLKEYERVTQKDLFGNAISAALVSGRKYDVITQNCDCSRESNVRSLVFQNKSVIKMQRRYRTEYGEDPPSHNGAGSPSTSQEDVDRIQEAVSRSLQKSIRRASLQLGVPQMTVHNRLHLHA
jgi:hypothetical protein